jgi:biopolymer transport protein ExbB/TolQ
MREAGPLIFPVILLVLVIAGLGVVNAVALIRRKSAAPSRRNSIDAILFWGSVAALIGFLGQWLGIMKIITVIVEHGVVSPNMVVLGLSESLLTPVAGMFVFVVSVFLWFFLRVGLWTKERRV